MGAINNKASLVHIMAGYQTGDKPLSGTMMAYFIPNTAMENNTPII